MLDKIDLSLPIFYRGGEMRSIEFGGFCCKVFLKENIL